MEIVPEIKPEQHRQAYSHNLLVYCTKHCISRSTMLHIDRYDISLALLSHFLEDLQVRQVNFALLAKILLQLYEIEHCHDFVIAIEVDLHVSRVTKLRKVSGAIVPSDLSSFCH